MPRHFYSDFLDPTRFFCDPLPKHPTPEDLDELYRSTKRMIHQSLILFVVFVVILAITSVFTSCATKARISESDTADHRISEMIDRMDSVIARRTVVQHDSAWRQEILRQFQSIREKSDTSRTLVVDTGGRIVRETLIINNTRETTSETAREQLTVMSRRLEVMDSTLSLMREQLSRSDSLMRQRQTVTERPVEQPLSLWQTLQIWLGRLVLMAMAVGAGWWIVRKQSWWLAVLRRLV